MNENTDSRKLHTELIYTLDVRIPDQSPKKLEVIDRVLAGIDPRNDLILIDPKIKAKHFLFRRRNNILTVHYLGRDGDSFLNGLPLEKGKLYILEKLDVLKVGKVEIIIRRETGIIKAASREIPVAPTPFTKINELADMSDFEDEKNEEVAQVIAEEEVEQEEFAFKEMPIHHKKLEAVKKERIFNFSTVKLIPYKIYGFVVDIALTYLLLSFVIPSLGFLSIVQDFLYPVTEFITSNLTIQQSPIASVKILSLIEFFICFHFLMIFTSLILGTTPGAFLIGLHHKDNNKSIFALRFKAYLYALLNIIVLPLLLFDIPLYKGKNMKELLTFSEREINTSFIFKLSRKAITPVLSIACVLSPFFLRPPYTASITIEKNLPPKYKDVHTTHLVSSSRELGFSLNSDLNKDYALLPYFENKKIGLALYDLKNKKALLMQEQNRISLSQALFKLRYSNPLASLNIPNNQIDNEVLKNKSMKSLELSLTTLLPGILEFGPMLANGFLFKEQFLKDFRSLDNFLLNSFDKKNPAIKISGAGREEKVFLFGRKEIIEFSLTVPKQTKLLENFTDGVINGLRYDQSNNDGLKDPQILEVLEAFERSKYSILLTYYINEAKKVHELDNPSWRAFFIKNVLQTKRALVEDKTRVGMNKNIEKSLDDIINTL
ncbi:MAG: FHA domain-containing protein [Bacteriovorax sp.]|nr:FHA domain-containing protein [Bacteriovorax sp.]